MTEKPKAGEPINPMNENYFTLDEGKSFEWVDENIKGKTEPATEKKNGFNILKDLIKN